MIGLKNPAVWVVAFIIAVILSIDDVKQLIDYLF